MTPNPITIYLNILESWHDNFAKSYKSIPLNPDAEDEAEFSGTIGNWGDRHNFNQQRPFNSIVDSEILLVFLLGHTVLPSAEVAPTPKQREENTKKVLASSISKNGGLQTSTLLLALREYFFRHTHITDLGAFATFDDFFSACEKELVERQTFNSFGYADDFDLPDDKEKQFETTDAYAFSLTVSLRAKILARKMASQNPGQAKLWDQVRILSDARLTASMTRLLDSFAASHIETEDS